MGSGSGSAVFTTPPTSTRSFPRRTPRSWAAGHAKSKRTIYASWAWPCWFPGFSYSSLLPGLRGQPERLVTFSGFWTIWSLATRCSAGNARTSPWFSIRETIGGKFPELDNSPTILLALWCLPAPRSIGHSFAEVSCLDDPVSPGCERIARRRKSLGGSARSSSPAAAPCSGGRSAHPAASEQKAARPAGSPETNRPQP